MFESILSELENLRKSRDGSNPKKVQLSKPDSEGPINELINQIKDIRLPVITPDLTPITQRLDTLTTQGGQSAPQSRNSTLRTVVLSVSLVLSLLLNLYLLWK